MLVTLYQHQATAFLVLSGFYFAWYFKRAGRWSWLAASYVWLAYAVGILIDYPNALLMAPVMIYFVLSSFNLSKTVSKYRLSFRPVIIIASITFFAVTLWHGYYNQSNFGRPSPC